MNLLALRNRVYRALGEDGTAPQHWTDAEINRYINDTYRQFSRDSGALEIEHALEGVKGTAEYDLPAQIGRIFRVEYDELRILPTSEYELDIFDSVWKSRDNTPFAYRIDQLNDKIAVYPIPTAEERAVFDSEFGTIIDMGPDDNFDSEFGVVIDIDDATGTDVMLFLDEQGSVPDKWVMDASVGLTADIDGSAFNQQTGLVTRITSDDTIVFNSEFGIITSASEGEYGVVIDYNIPRLNLSIWAKKDPDDLATDTDEPELPEWTHQAIVFGAAARALRKESEARNFAVAGAYEQLASLTAQKLKRIVMTRMPERVLRPKMPRDRLTRVRAPRLPGNYPDVFANTRR